MSRLLHSSLAVYVLIVLSHLAVIAIWHFWVVIADVRSFIMPTPLATLETLTSAKYRWVDNTLVTAAEIYGGYALGVAVGVSLALLFSWFRTVNSIFMPLFVSLNMIPKVALGPLFIVWFSFGIRSNIIIAFSICFFPILLNTARGLREVEPELIELVRSIRASKWQVFTKIQLPGSLPYVFSGMKVGAILAVAGAIVGEFIASDRGLGFLMIQVQATLDTAGMFMSVMLISLVGVSLYLMVLALERTFVVRDERQE